ncbi:MAG: transposase [Anaerolineae bacterium]|nr:transposase [Anaerolineae bacterium]
MIWRLEDCGASIRYLIYDRDKKFSHAFDSVLRSKRIRILRTPVKAPNANAFAERWIRSVREECLDHLLIWNETHLNRVLLEYVDYFNTRHPHQSLAFDAPEGLKPVVAEGVVPCRNGLGGIIHDYYREAA